MKKITCLLLSVLSIAMLFSCKDSANPLLPRATGIPFELLVVMDKAQWNAPAGRTLFDILNTTEAKTLSELSKNKLETANPTNVVMFKTSNQFTVPEGHYAKFPESLAEFFILAGCPEKGIVLDPFMGSGTVAVVAKKLNRHYIGIELNEDYIKMAQKRLDNMCQLEF